MTQRMTEAERRKLVQDIVHLTRHFLGVQPIAEARSFSMQMKMTDLRDQLREIADDGENFGVLKRR